MAYDSFGSMKEKLGYEPLGEDSGSQPAYKVGSDDKKEQDIYTQNNQYSQSQEEQEEGNMYASMQEEENRKKATDERDELAKRFNDFNQPRDSLEASTKGGEERLEDMIERAPSYLEREQAMQEEDIIEKDTIDRKAKIGAKNSAEA